MGAEKTSDQSEHTTLMPSSMRGLSRRSARDTRHRRGRSLRRGL